MNRLKYWTGIVVAMVFTMVAASVSAQDIIAAGGTITSQYAGNGTNEAIDKLIDGSASSKYLTFNVPPFWIQWRSNTPQVLGGYNLTSANDDATRDPRNWTLEASNNGTNWTVLDTRTDQVFPQRLMSRTFFVSNATAYEYYRLNVSAIGGATLFQLGEWGLFGASAPDAPSGLTALSSGGNELVLSWLDNTAAESAFEIERSTNGTDFVKIGSTGVNVLQYVDMDASANKTYHYRVRAVNPYGQSAYASRTITTLDINGGFVDLTDDGGTLRVARENSGSSENSPKLIDNNFNTKYLIQGGFSPYWFSYQSATGASRSVTKYTLVSGGDAEGRDPKSWVFEGSNDGNNYTILDTRTNEVFPNRNEGRTFRLAAPAQYTYYRISVSANNGSGIAGQISEWQIWGLYTTAPKPPDELAATTLSKTEIKLDWEVKSTDESGFEVERLGSNGQFAMVKQLPAKTQTYTDAGLTPATRYFYRIRATGTGVFSAYSNRATDSTLYDPNLPLPPRNLAGTVVSDTELDLTWTDESENETGFKVQRSRDGVAFSTVGTVGEGETTYNDVTVLLGTKYYYRILAFNTNGDALLYSNIASVITSGANETPFMDPIADVVTCNTNDDHTIPLTAISPGVEAYQKIILSVTSKHPDMYDQLTVTQPVDGLAELLYNLAEGADGRDTVTVTVLDDGGNLNGGNDTYTVTYYLDAYQLDLFVGSQTGTVVPRGEYITLTASSSLAETFEWMEGPGITTGQLTNELTVRPTRGFDYTVVGRTSEGCERSASITVQVEGNFSLAPGNILTPNGDGKNDTWIIWNIHTYPGSTVKVLDVSGREVFSQKDYTNDWSGTYKGQKLKEGVYYYIIDLGGGIGTMRGSLNVLYAD